MNVGRAPIHCTLNGVASFSVMLLVERGEGQVELQQGGVAQHAERPLVGIRDDRHALVFQDGGPSLRRCRRRGERVAGSADLPGRDQEARLGEAGEETGSGQGGPVGERPIGQGAQDGAVLVEDPRVRIAERSRFNARVGSRVHGGYRVSWSCCFRLKSSLIRPQYNRSATPTAANPPSSTWSSMLPLPGSR